jgi:hypothetical protein
MADSRQHKTWGSRLRFLLRGVGLAGVAVAVVGAGLAAAALPAVDFGTQAGWKSIPALLREAANGDHGALAQTGTYLLVGGLGALALAVAVEALGALFTGVGRRTAASTSATLGAVAAVALLLLVNTYSFTHSARFDCTRDKRFTLPPELAEQLEKMRASAPTTIVVLQKHKMFGNLQTERDSYTKAAEAVVTEKVQDLVDRFREFGPQFNVVVFDTEAFGYKERLNELTRDAPELKAAIKDAPENSILFHANKRVQRLAFNEFLQLDHAASRASDDPDLDGRRANLVLLPQGTETFARRVLAVQERRPKVAVCVVHEWLTTAAVGRETFSLAGAKKALAAQGFDVVDVVLKKNWNDATKPDLEPSAYTLDENKLERLEGDVADATDELRVAQLVSKRLEVNEKAFAEPTKEWRDRGKFYTDLLAETRRFEWTELLAAFRRWSVRERPLTEADDAEFRATLAPGFAAQKKRAEEALREARDELAKAERELAAVAADERATEERRAANVKAKFARLVADVDLLIVPRYTLVNAPDSNAVGAGLHALDRKQIEVMKEFMKAGKPVLACLGAISAPDGPDARGSDGFERLLRDRGIELGRDAVLYDAERKAFAAARSGSQLAGGGTTVPPLTFDATTGARANPIAAAYRLTGRTAEANLELRLHAPRPVYLAPGWDAHVPFAAEFLFTPAAAWNEERPFQTGDRSGRITYTPRFDPTPEGDPKFGTPAEERRAAFPIAVAVESPIPAAWLEDDYARQQAVAALLVPRDGIAPALLTVAAKREKRPLQRTVVFGSGHLFTGGELKPAQERLLLHTANWLTGRADRLPKADAEPWQYPRVELTAGDRALWRFGALVWMPLAVFALGVLAVLVRRTR